MLSISEKREQFYEEIRHRQKEQVFAKLRKENKQRVLFQPSKLSSIEKQIASLEPRCQSLQQIYDLQKQIQILISSVRRLEQIPSGKILNPVFQFLLKIVEIIESHAMSDFQSPEMGNIEQMRQDRESPFSTILLKISYFLINFLSEQDEVVSEYFSIIVKFTKYPIFIECFHNIFLNTVIDRKIKLDFTDQFICLLENNPVYFLNHCDKMSPIIYYALCQPPSLLGQAYFHHRIINLIQRMMSILDFNSSLEIQRKNQFRFFAYLILSKLTYSCLNNCQHLLKGSGDYIMRDLCSILQKLQNHLSCDNGSEDEQYRYISNSLALLNNLTFYEAIVDEIYQSYPALWYRVLQIYPKISLSSQNSIGKRLPRIYKTIQMKSITQKMLNLISNMISNAEACEDFISLGNNLGNNLGNSLGKQNKQPKSEALQTLTQIYNENQNNKKSRLECLYILSNVLVVVAKQAKNVHSIGMGFKNEAKDDDEDDEVIPMKVNPSSVIQSSSDLIYQVLKLPNSNKQIIKNVLSSLLSIIEESEQKLGKCWRIFRDTSFIIKLREMAAVDEPNYSIEKYSEDVRLHAHYLMEAVLVEDKYC